MRRFSPLLVLVALLLLLAAACTRETDEGRIRKVITDAQKSAEEKKIMAVLAHVSKSYHDRQDNNYDAVKGLLAYYFFRHQKVSVFIPDIEVAVTGASAKAVFQAVFTGRGTGNAASQTILPDALGAYAFEVSFQRENSDWMVVSAVWERAGEGAPGPRQ